jgi:Tfp pilus assembly protein PilN
MTLDMSNQQQPPVPPPVQVVPEASLDSMLGSGGFPSANLLPPAIITRRQVRAAKRKALIIIVGVLGAIIFAVLFTSLQQRSADSAKAQAQTEVDSAIVLKQKYAYVPAVYTAVTTARQELATAMGQEVQVSRLLGGLSALQPPSLSLTTLDASVGPGAQEAMSTDQTVIPGVGTVAFQGEAKSIDDIAAWIDRLRDSADYETPILTDVTNSAEGVYAFTASADLSDQALSGRYVEPTQ